MLQDGVHFYSRKFTIEFKTNVAITSSNKYVKGPLQYGERPHSEVEALKVRLKRQDCVGLLKSQL